MKRLWLAVALAACGKDDAPPKPPDKPTVRLPAATPTVGLVISEDSQQSSTMKLLRDSEATELREDEREVSESEVLEVKGGAITRVRITYAVKQTKRSFGDQEQVEPSPLEGNSYEVWSDGGEIKAARTDGSTVSDAEATALAEAHGDLGSVPTMTRVLADRAWVLGERVALPADQLAGLSHDDAVKATAAAFTCSGSNGTVATFDDQITLVKDDAAGRIETSMSGAIELDLTTARPNAIVTSGTSTGTLRGEMAGTTLQGTTESRAVYRYR